MTPAEELERAYSALASYGVPKERAKNLPNGLGVLMTRIDREIEALRHERNVLQKICAERADEIERLKAMPTEELHTATPERRSSPGHSEVKPDGNDDRRSGAVDQESSGSERITRGAAMGAGGAERGPRTSGGGADQEVRVTGEGTSVPSPRGKQSPEKP